MDLIIAPTSTGKRVEIRKGKLALRRLFMNDFQKEGSITAEIEQVVITTSFYPAKKVSSDMQAGLFSLAEFGYAETPYESTETRISWVPVPVDSTVEEVAVRLAVMEAAGATNYKVLANEPILDENQKFAIGAKRRTKDQFAATQVCRYPKGHADEGKLILDENHNPFYRRIFFMDKPQVDIDARDKNKVYLSPEIIAEMQGAAVLQGQTV